MKINLDNVLPSVVFYAIKNRIYGYITSTFSTLVGISYTGNINAININNINNIGSMSG